MAKQSRRDFLRNTALVSASLMLPRFLRAAQHSAFSHDAEGKVLVVIQFSGGNDGLNTVIPYRNDIYYRERPGLGLGGDDLLRLDDQQALHPNLVGLKELFDDGVVSVLNGIGYPNPNRSHFRSMDIWHTGSGSEAFWQSGWIGRMLDAQCPDCAPPYMAMEVSDTLSLALKGQQVAGIAASNPARFYKNTREPFFYSISQQKKTDTHDHPALAYLHKTLVETTASAEYVFEKSKIYKSQVAYPGSKLAQQLKQIAQLIVANSATRVYYVSMPGFDTHIAQKGTQGRLLRQYGNALRAFVQDLKQNGRFEDTLIMTFSEFGRRVAQNASGGTDHGTANNMFLISGGLKKPGIFNAPPDLSDLDEGDLKYDIDFRRVYATVLDRWLAADSGAILRKKFAQIDVV